MSPEETPRPVAQRPLPPAAALPRALYRADQVRALDRAAIEQAGICGTTLMERAGAAVFALLRRRWPHARRLLVLAGAGNNGGDGYVLARLASEQGLAVELLTLGNHDTLQGEAAAAAAALRRSGGRGRPFETALPQVDLICDALLGTGLERPVKDRWAAAIEAVNAARVPVLAVDIPSGLHADTGRILGTAVRADATISFIGLKQGLFTGQGPDCCGDISFDALEVPARIYGTQVAAARRLDWTKAREQLPRRRRAAHKGDCGHLLIIGGAPGMSGALRLCGEAALRTGAGLVTLGTHPEHAALLNLTRPELMVQAIADPRTLRDLAGRADVVAIGPGLGQAARAEALFAEALALERPLVVDADGLNLLARRPERRDHWVLTPHPGEAGRLLGQGAADIEADRFAAAAALQQRYGGTAVLKGAGTLIRGPGQRPTAVCSDGNPGMASGGMGDALTGIIGALLAQGLGPEQAAEVGVCLHGAAGDAAARDGERGLLASDLIEQLRAVLGAADGGNRAR
jgi:NAD(P)H-hydrate epimerase